LPSITPLSPNYLTAARLFISFAGKKTKTIYFSSFFILIAWRK